MTEKFCELEYKRPDVAQVKKLFADATKALAGAKSYEEARKCFFDVQLGTREFETSYVIASIRNTMDTTDEFYDGEMQFLNAAYPKLVPCMKKYTKALLTGRFRADFEAEFGPQLMRLTENDDRIQSSKNIFLMIRESKLEMRYQKLAASCKADFRGEECNFYGLLKHMESADRDERREAFNVWASLYEKIAPELDEIYDKLVAIRIRMAKNLKLSSYIELAYLGKRRFDYTQQDAARFRRQIEETVVPICARLREAQAKRIGVDKLRYYDETFMFPDGNADPEGTPEEMVAAANEMYHELSAESGEFFDFMIEHELFDLITRPGKHLGGYCTSLSKYRAPFIFSNFNGTSADVGVLTHEAGHAFEYYVSSRCQPIDEYNHSTSEINEIHSMAMEHFTYPWMKKFFGKNTDKYLYSHLADALMTVPYLVAVDEFQHRVFENPRMSADERRGVWKTIEKKYLPWRDYDGMEYMEKGGFWMQKQHIFLYPFYYIDYALAQMGAFELYGRMKQNGRAAWEDYMRLCRAGGSKGYFELLKFAGLSNPFEDGSVKRIVAPIAEELEKSKYSK